MPELVFKGKEYVYNHHLTVPYRPLLPQQEKSVGRADLAGNLVIQGDNLHALKSLLPRYAGKVDLVFIDPPYNTGTQDWYYNDAVNSPVMKEWLSSNPVNAEDMLRHDKWLCMMWPRLILLEQLLSDRGVAAICIDENEVHRLALLCEEIFGEEAHIGSIAWRTRNVDNRVSTKLSVDHEYVILLSKQRRIVGRTIDRSGFRNTDADPRGPYVTDPLTGKAKADRRPNLHHTIVNPNTGDRYEPDPSLGWITDSAGVFELMADDRIAWPENPRTGKPRKKRFLTETAERMPESTFWSDFKGQSGYDDLDQLMGGRVFDFPKPLGFVERVVDLCSPSDGLVLDAFAGSGTTAHAVLKANARDGGQRRFILVESEDYADSLTAERVRRAIKGYAWVGTQRETLLEQKITWTQFRKADEWLQKVEAVKTAEGFSDTHRSGQPQRFDKLNVRLDDGLLVVEGERRVSERAEGLGGEFTYCALGDPVDLTQMLSGQQLPTFDALGAWLFYTATGAALGARATDAPEGYLGEAADAHVWLIYRPDLAFLKSPQAALSLDVAAAMQAWGQARADGKGHLVFAPAKFMSNRQLLDHGVRFALLPFALYREG